MTKNYSRTVTGPRQRLLEKLSGAAAKVSPRYLPLRWALAYGYARASADGYEITPEGSSELAASKMDPGMRQAVKLLPKLVGKTLVRTSTATEDGRTGGGFTYHTEPDHKPFPPGAGRALIASGLLVAAKDGLLEGVSQTYRLTGGR